MKFQYVKTALVCLAAFTLIQCRPDCQSRLESIHLDEQCKGEVLRIDTPKFQHGAMYLVIKATNGKEDNVHFSHTDYSVPLQKVKVGDYVIKESGSLTYTIIDGITRDTVKAELSCNN